MSSGPKEIEDGIDPVLARRLMQDYCNAIGVNGGSEIERAVQTHTKKGLHRKTAEDWINRGKPPTKATLGAALAFFRTTHFQEKVPHAKAYIDSDARFRRTASVLFAMYGTFDLGTQTLKETTASMAGWWIAPPIGSGHDCSFMSVVPIDGQPFSRIYVCVRGFYRVLGTGVMFCQGEPWDHYVRLWLPEWSQAEIVMRIVCVEREDGQISPELIHHPVKIRSGTDEEFSKVNVITAGFSRLKEDDVPADVREMFDEWGRAQAVLNEGRSLPYRKL